MNYMDLLKVINSGMYAQRKRIDLIATNLANMETLKTEKGTPYRRKMMIMRSEPMDDFDSILSLEMVKIDEIVEDKTPFKRVYQPSHPYADKDGYVLKPNVDPIVEITNLMISRTAYEANVTAFKITKEMILKALEIGSK